MARSESRRDRDEASKGKTLSIYCGECDARLVVRASDAGKATRCKACNARLPIPSSDLRRPQIRRFCPQCGGRVRAWVDQAGKLMICPRCKEEMELPALGGKHAADVEKERKEGDTRPIKAAVSKDLEDEAEDETEGEEEREEKGQEVNDEEEEEEQEEEDEEEGRPKKSVRDRARRSDKEEWYYDIGGGKIGPVWFSFLQALAKEGKLDADDLVLQESTNRWRRAGDIPEMITGRNPKGPCPVCGRKDDMGDRARLIYGEWTCGTCRASLFWKRAIAFILDAIALSVLAGIAASIAGLVAGFLAAKPSPSSVPAPERLSPVHLAMFVGLGVSLLLFVIKDSTRGRSLGKAVTGLKVVDAGAETPIGLGQSFMRNLCLIIPFVPIVAAIQIHARGRRWGEGWAHTRVVQEE